MPLVGVVGPPNPELPVIPSPPSDPGPTTPSKPEETEAGPLETGVELPPPVVVAAVGAAPVGAAASPVVVGAAAEVAFAPETAGIDWPMAAEPVRAIAEATAKLHRRRVRTVAGAADRGRVLVHSMRTGQQASFPDG
jgi:hypothetical protein